MANFMLFTKEEVKKFKNIGNPNKFILLKSNNTSDSAKILSKFAEDYIYVSDIFKDFVKFLNNYEITTELIKCSKKYMNKDKIFDKNNQKVCNINSKYNSLILNNKNTNNILSANMTNKLIKTVNTGKTTLEKYNNLGETINSVLEKVNVEASKPTPNKNKIYTYLMIAKQLEFIEFDFSNIVKENSKKSEFIISNAIDIKNDKIREKLFSKINSKLYVY